MKQLYFSLLFIAAFSHAQTVNWATKFGDVGNDICSDVAVDAAGNVYAVGIFKNSVDFNPGSGVFYINELSNETGDAYCVKLNSSGQLVWAKPIGGASGYSSQEETIPTITLDPAGNIYIAGIYQNNVDMDPGPGTLFLPVTEDGGSTGNFVCKLTNNGTLVWCKRYGGSFGFSFNRRIKADAAGNIYLAGYFSNVMYFQTAAGTATTLTTTYDKYNGYLAKFDTNGNNVWAFQLGADAKNDYIRDMDLDDSGNIVITGSYSATVDFDPQPGTELTMASIMDGEDIFIAKYNASTTECQWAKSFGRQGSAASESGYTVAFGNEGSVVGTGFFRVEADFNPAPGEENVYNMASVGGSSLYFLKLSADGGFIWAKTIGAISETGVNHSEKTYGMDTDAAGNIYITGDYVHNMDADPDEGVHNLGSNGGSYQTFYMKLNGEGGLEWAKAMGPDTNKSATGRVIKAAPNNNVIIGGRFHGPMDFNQGGTPFIINGNYPSYDSFLMSLDQSTLRTEEWFDNPIAVYPNPFTDAIHISSNDDILAIELYDAAGRLVLSVKNQRALITSGLRSGLYIVKVYSSTGASAYKVLKP